MGTSKSKQKALLHRDRKENATNTHSLEIQNVILSTFPSSSMDGSVFAGTASSPSRTSCPLSDHHSDVHAVKTKFLPSGSKLVLMVLKSQKMPMCSLLMCLRLWVLRSSAWPTLHQSLA
jgi:hypothetical protein